MTVSPDPKFTGLGFAMGSVRGARAFRVDDEGFLLGIFYRQRWLPGVTEARCRREQRAGGRFNMFGGGTTEPVDYNSDEPEIPLGHLADCMCGLYGFYNGSNDYNRIKTPNKDYVSGVIEGWGETVIGTRGFRCTKARILALQITPGVKHFEAVVPRYASIPMFTTFDDMIREFPPGDGGDVIASLPAAGEE